MNSIYINLIFRLEEYKERINFALNQEYRNDLVNKQQMMQKKTRQNAEEDEDDQDRYSEFSSDSNESSYGSGSRGKSQESQKSRRSQSSESSQSSDSSQDIEVVDGNEKSKKRRDVKAAAKEHQQVSKIVDLDLLKDIILKRSQIEGMLDHPKMDKTVIGCFTRVSLQGKYRLVEITDVKEDGPMYQILQQRTNTQVQLKQGLSKKWFKISLLSNGPATNEEFESMINWLRKDNQQLPQYDKIQKKIQDLNNFKKHKLTQEEIDEMVSKKLNRRIKEGDLGSYNLSYLKADLENKVNQYKNQLNDCKGAKKDLIQQLQSELAQSIKNLEIVEKAYKDQIEKAQPKVKDVDITIEELEKKQAADNWVKQQEQYQRDPNAKRGGKVFMTHLTRQDSEKPEDQEIESEKQKIKMQKELEMIRRRSQLNEEESKHETYYEKMERLKKEYLKYHEMELSFDSITKRFKSDNFCFQPQQVRFDQPHPSWEEAIDYIIVIILIMASTAESQLKTTSDAKPSSNLLEEIKAPPKPAPNRTIGHYQVGKSLGQGTFGKVRLGTHTLTGEKVAIKILEKDKILDQADVERVTREIQILKIVRHPNVIQLYEIIETNRQLFLIMEYASGGELFDYIVKKKRLQDKEACRFFQQLLSGIEYLHKNKICHRDLKPENLLLDENNNLKIVDFGLSITYKVGETLKTACGSPCYAAPEMIAGKRYHGLPADIWSSGIILYAMACGYLPFEDPNTNKLYKKILNCDYLIPGFISPGCKDLIKKILNTDPNTRLKLSDIRSHDWYQQIQNIEMEGIIVGVDPIPIIEDVKQQIEDSYKLDDIEYAERFIKMNKHNHVTTTYYLLLKKNERETGRNQVFERVTKEKRSYNSTGNLGQPHQARNQLQQTGLYFRGHSQQLGAAKLNQTVLNFATASKSEQKTRTGSSGDNSFAIGSSEFFQNLNPVTKQYLEQIEKSYKASSQVDGASPHNQGNLAEKYKQMRDTAIDIGKWINAGYNKGSNPIQNTTFYETSFLDQRNQRQNKQKEQTERPISYDVNNKHAFQQTSNMLPTVGQKHPQNKSMMHRLTMYNYNVGGSNKNSIINQAFHNGQKLTTNLNLSNFSTVKSNTGDVKKHKSMQQSNQDIVVNSSFMNTTSLHMRNDQPSKNKDLSLYTVYRPSNGGNHEAKKHNPFASGNHSFIQESSEYIDRQEQNNLSVIEKTNKKLINDMYMTSKKFAYPNISSQKVNQNQNIGTNNIILPFQMTQMKKKSSVQRNESVNESTVDTQSSGHIQIANLVKQGGQTAIKKDEFKAKYAQIAQQNAIKGLSNKRLMII